MATTKVTTGGITDATIATADIADQAITLAKLPHGTSSNDGKFLRANNGADPSFETVSIPAGTTINNNADNRGITGSGTANTLEGESNLTWDGNDLSLSGTAPAINFTDTDSDDYKIHNVQGVLKITDTTASADRFVINDNGTGYFQSNFQIGSTTTSPGATLHVKSSYPSLKIDDGDNGTNAYIGIIAGTGKESNLNFGDPADDDHSQISYDHNGDHMKFKIGGTEKFRVNSNGICIGGTGSANALDDYEEGTWTPEFDDAYYTSPGTTYNSRAGSYIKIGRMVLARFHVNFAGCSNSNAGPFISAGLPFTPDTSNISSRGLQGTVSFSGIDAPTSTINVNFGYHRLDNNIYYLGINSPRDNTSDGNASAIQAGNISNGDTISGTVMYMSAS